MRFIRCLIPSSLETRRASFSPLVTRPTGGPPSSSTAPSPLVFTVSLYSWYSTRVVVVTIFLNYYLPPAIYHLGIIKALFENHLLPKVICGASSGALVAALVCSHTDDDLPTIFLKDNINFKAFQKRSEVGRLRRRLLRLWRQGVLMDIRLMEECMRDNIGDITFLEAYHKTGRILNITLRASGIGHGVPLLLNYLNAPNVVIWSAACASCSVVGLYDRVDILTKAPNGTVSKWDSDGVNWTGMNIEG